MESGVSKSMRPSRVCSICAAVDIFLLPRRRVFILNPGIDASTSRIVDAGPCCSAFADDVFSLRSDVLIPVDGLIDDDFTDVANFDVESVASLLARDTIGSRKSLLPALAIGCCLFCGDRDVDDSSVGGFTIIRGGVWRNV